MSSPRGSDDGVTGRGLPPVDRVTQPWWDATRVRRLLIQRCVLCDRLQHYPRALCTSCGGSDLGWIEVSGGGTIDSFTVVHRALPGFVAPYVVARVRLAEDVVLLSNIVDDDGAPSDGRRVRCDASVALRWEALADGRNLPVFVLAAGEVIP